MDGKAAEAEGGFKAVTWNACVDAIRPYYKGSSDLTAKCTKNKFGSYKRIWRIFAVKPEGWVGTRHNPESKPKNLSEELKSQLQREGNVRLAVDRDIEVMTLYILSPSFVIL